MRLAYRSIGEIDLIRRMTGVAHRSQVRYAAFVVAALLINILDRTLIRSEGDPRRQVILALAASVDVVIVVTALYYWLLVRPGLRTNASMIAVIVLSVIRAGSLFPARSVKVLVAGVCEMLILAFVVIYTRRITRVRRDAEVDPVEAIRTAVQTVLPIPIAVNGLTAELSILYYALFSWGAKPHVPVDAQPLTNYKKIGQAELLGTLPIACAVEMIPVHLLLDRWNSALAWAVTGLSVYASIWLVGVARSFRLRPTLIWRDRIYLRYGLLFQVQVPRALIACTGRALPKHRQFAVPRRADPTHYIEFSREVTAGGLFGFQRRVKGVALASDDQLAFERRVGQSEAGRANL